MIDAIIIAAAALVFVLTAPGTIELIVLTVAGSLPARVRRPVAQLSKLRIAIVIPAHNEQSLIARTVNSLSQCLSLGSPHHKHSIVVVADNCIDQTAERARAAGARVLIRQQETRRGKGYALQYAFEVLLEEGFDAFFVVDADSRVESNFIAEIERLLISGADAVQTRYGVLNPEDSIRTRLMNVALMGFNVLRPRGRERLGLSVGIFGNGFALTRETLKTVPYDAHSVVEDLEYHLRLVRAGRAVRFADKTTVWGEMPAGGAAAATQRARWEGGRFRMIREHVPELFKEVAAGHLTMAEPLLDLLLLPLAFHIALVLAGFALPYGPIRWFAATALGVVGAHVICGVVVAGGSFADLRALAFAPFYMAWKLAMLPMIGNAARRESTWVRTARHDSQGEVR